MFRKAESLTFAKECLSGPKGGQIRNISMVLIRFTYILSVSRRIRLFKEGNSKLEELIIIVESLQWKSELQIFYAKKYYLLD